MSTQSIVSLMLLLMSVVAVSLPLLDDSLQMRAFLDSVAFSEISTFETAPFEDFLAAAGSEAIDVRRHYYRIPLKKANYPDDDIPYRTVTYPRESLAAVDKRAQTIVVFYHGEEEEEVNATKQRSSSCPTVPSC